jgi:hypothetical protein
MRVIDTKAADAFTNRKRFTSSNTKVDIVDGLPHLYLFGHLIAKIDRDDNLLINHCGWKTRTTSSRLNALPGVRITLVKGDFIITKMGHMERMPEGWINLNKS